MAPTLILARARRALPPGWRRALPFAASLLLPIATPARGAPAPDTRATWTVQGENDSVSTTPGGSDKFYSSGLRIGWTSSPGGAPAFAADLAQWVWGDGITRVSLNLTHQIYTPEDIKRTQPDPNDRPLAGYVAGTFSILQDKSNSRSVLALTAGVIGPSALGRQVQNGFHKLLRIGLNNGWDSQLPDEPQVQFLVERTWRVPLTQPGGLEADLLPSLTAGVGTVRDYLQTGVVLRLGQGLQRDFGVARIRPGVSGGDVFSAAPGFAWYVFGGASGQAVARDAFLDGSLWRNSPSVQRNSLVGAFEAGAAIIWHGVRFSYTHTWETGAFKGQGGGLFNFGSLAASIVF